MSIVKDPKYRIKLPLTLLDDHLRCLRPGSAFSPLYLVELVHEVHGGSIQNKLWYLFFELLLQQMLGELRSYNSSDTCQLPESLRSKESNLLSQAVAAMGHEHIQYSPSLGIRKPAFQHHLPHVVLTDLKLGFNFLQVEVMLNVQFL